MTNKKISALTSATTPLAGTETLPIVQSSATVKATVANIVGAGTSPGSFTTLKTSSADGSVNTFLVGGTNAVRVVSAAGSIQVAATNAAGSAYAQLNLDGTTVVLASSGTPIFRTNATDSTFVTGNVIQGTAAKGINFTANTPAAGMTSQLLNWYEEGTWTPNQGAGLTVVGAFSSTGRYTRIGRQVSISGTVTGATSVAVTAAGVITSNLPFTVVTAGHGDATNVAINASATVICTGTSVTSAAAIAATATITFSATYFV
jgi:hypothetical protein